MKRFFAMALAVAFMMSAAACNNKKDKENSSESVPAVTTENAAQATEAVADENNAETTAVAETTAAATEAATEEFTMPEDIPTFEAALEDEVLAAAQELFEKACETEWRFTVGSPYDIDTENYITGDYGWQYFLITNEEITSMDDVRADYHEVFSVDYEDTLDELFMESEGRVYCLNGARGSDIFYEGSEVTEIEGRDDGEIRFKVVDSYNGASFGGEAYTEEREFVIIKEDDGQWKVSVFKLPY